MFILALDVETTIWNKGHLHDPRNRLVCTSWAASDNTSGCVRGCEGIQELVERADLIVGFNWKFDLGWLRKNGIVFNTRFYDAQLAEFILSRQTWMYPDLDTAAELRLGTRKIDVVKTEFWDKGINTDQIPWEILSEYATHDARLHLNLFNAQMKILSAVQRRLVMQQSADLEIIQEMEWNGLLFDEELCAKRSEEIDNQISEITKELSHVYRDIPINFNSGDHLSAFLYGGVIQEEVREMVGHYKTGAKVGQPRYRIHVKEHVLPQLCKPLRGSELKKKGFYATNEDTLKKLKGAKKYINWILELSKLDKLNGTYYKGLRKLREDMGWERGVLHGTLNQVSTRTGRLSAVKPNQQNFASELQNIFISRYD